MFYSSDVSDVFLQSIFKLNNEKNQVTSITISKSQLGIMLIVKSHDQEESKLNSTINAKGGVHTLTHDKIIKKVLFSRVRILKLSQMLNGCKVVNDWLWSHSQA